MWSLLNYWFSFIEVDILRGIDEKISGDFFLRKVLIVPILTGTALMEFNSIEAAVGTSTYQPALISVGVFQRSTQSNLRFKLQT
jgi:hypothetical protein